VVSAPDPMLASGGAFRTKCAEQANPDSVGGQIFLDNPQMGVWIVWEMRKS